MSQHDNQLDAILDKAITTAHWDIAGILVALGSGPTKIQALLQQYGYPAPTIHVLKMWRRRLAIPTAWLPTLFAVGFQSGKLADPRDFIRLGSKETPGAPLRPLLPPPGPVKQVMVPMPGADPEDALDEARDSLHDSQERHDALHEEEEDNGLFE